jgi:general secretion pathway protein G
MARNRRGRVSRARALATRGMTLIEIMVVVAIIGMLMGTVGVFAFGRLKKAKITDTKMVIKNVEQALVHFQTDNTDACPKSVSDLFTQKYLTKEPLDAWGQALQFKCPGEHNTDGADIVSKGEDKQEGTQDDIKSWEL